MKEIKGRGTPPVAGCTAPPPKGVVRTNERCALLWGQASGRVVGTSPFRWTARGPPRRRRCDASPGRSRPLRTLNRGVTEARDGLGTGTRSALAPPPNPPPPPSSKARMNPPGGAWWLGGAGRNKAIGLAKSTVMRSRPYPTESALAGRAPNTDPPRRPGLPRVGREKKNSCFVDMTKTPEALPCHVTYSC